MQRYDHFFQPATSNWTCAKTSFFTLQLEANNKQNHAGFSAFHLSRDIKINCVLYIIDNEIKFNEIQDELVSQILDNSGLFESVRLSNEVTSGKATWGYLVSTENARVAEILLNYVNSKLQLSEEHYETLKNMLPKDQLNVSAVNECRIL